MIVTVVQNFEKETAGRASAHVVLKETGDSSMIRPLANTLRRRSSRIRRVGDDRMDLARGTLEIPADDIRESGLSPLKK